ncbi:hypothetical protein MIR68_003280 [Amoeboaphelidium protococcarum]|nr:hypothetical protein MIR68_003280 [Amoeboaphelidium protococcarum]
MAEQMQIDSAVPQESGHSDLEDDVELPQQADNADIEVESLPKGLYFTGYNLAMKEWAQAPEYAGLDLGQMRQALQMKWQCLHEDDKAAFHRRLATGDFSGELKYKLQRSISKTVKDLLIFGEMIGLESHLMTAKSKDDGNRIVDLETQGSTLLTTIVNQYQEEKCVDNLPLEQTIAMLLNAYNQNQANGLDIILVRMNGKAQAVSVPRVADQLVVAEKADPYDQIQAYFNALWEPIRTASYPKAHRAFTFTNYSAYVRVEGLPQDPGKQAGVIKLANPKTHKYSDAQLRAIMSAISKKQISLVPINN